MSTTSGSTGVCVVLLPNPGGVLDDIPDAHLTLHYLGRESNFLPDELDQMGAMVKHYSTMYPSQIGEVTGSATFLNPMGDVFVWLFDSVGLGGFRQVIHDLTDRWRRSPESHGFIPHVTVPDGFGPPAEPYPVTWGRIALWAGGVRYEYPLLPRGRP